jgi:hypothetical protein
MAFLTENLGWTRQLARFNHDERKVLLTLSDDRYVWRTKEGIIATAGIDKERVESILAALIEDGIVRPAFSRDRDVLFALAERVE